MDLSTEYLGMKLRTPLVPSASPLSEDVDAIKRMVDAGASAVVLHSLFEEQLRREAQDLNQHLTQGTESYAESLTYFPEPQTFHVGPSTYLDHIRRAKAAVDVPIIASLNGTTKGTWIDYARQIEEAGADALELNIYWIPTDPWVPAAKVEDRYFDILHAVRDAVDLPLAVKLSPYFSSLANLARELAAAGAGALVLFNRFYQPDIDLEQLEVTPNVMLSTPIDMRLPMTWIGILYGRVAVDLAATSGIHHGTDVVKMLMVGAKVTMLCSVLLKRGIEQITRIERELTTWLEEHQYESVRQMQGSMSQKHCADPSAFERAQYMRALQGY